MRTLMGTMRTAVVEAWSNRRSFWVQASAMIVNDAAWVAFWALFFHKIGQVRGWRSDQVMLMFVILATVTGISMGLLANARKLGQLVADGQLDAVLTLPVDPLAYLLVRRVDTALLGDLAFGPVLFAVAAHPTPQRTALYVLGALTSSAVLVSFVVVLGSVTMVAGGRGEQADLGFQTLLILASYPLDVFGGLTKLMMFTVIPAAFLTRFPSTWWTTSAGRPWPPCSASPSGRCCWLAWRSGPGCGATSRVPCGPEPERVGARSGSWA
jgi:ABC-2 type transport system permease protein